MHGPKDPASRDYVAMICTREWKYVHFPNLGIAVTCRASSTRLRSSIAHTHRTDKAYEAVRVLLTVTGRKKRPPLGTAQG